jgi:hypothetical protein
MKIRKLILKAKLQQIEKQYQYVFIYHCSGLTNPQWRQLKNCLYKTNCKTFFQPKKRQQGPLRSSTKFLPFAETVNSKQAAYTMSSVPPSVAVNAHVLATGGDLTSETKLACLSGPFCIFYLSAARLRLGGAKHCYATSLPPGDPEGPQGTEGTEGQSRSLQSYVAPAARLASQPSGNLGPKEAPKGKVATQPYFGQESNGSWSDVVKKIDSLEYKTNLILLYAQIKSTLVNHIDIKQALNLETRSVYQQFLCCLKGNLQTLDFCLYQNRKSLPSILDTQDRGCEARPKRP